MRWLLLLLTPAGCTLVTDFDREVRVVLEITAEIPEPELTSTLDQARAACTSACALAQGCLYDTTVTAECAHAPTGARHQASNDAILLSTCVGICVAADAVLATGTQTLETCEDFAEKPVLEAVATDIFCGGDKGLCETNLCLAVGDTTVLETCVGISLYGTCTPNCESLPAEFWSCVFEDAGYEAVRFDARNPRATKEEKDEFNFQVLCRTLSRCAGAPSRGFE